MTLGESIDLMDDARNNPPLNDAGERAATNPVETPRAQRLAEIEARMHRITDAPWGIMYDGPNGDGKPWKAFREAAAGLTVASPSNTEPIARVSGYLQPVEANADFIVHAPTDVAWLLSRLAELQDTLELCQRALQVLASETHVGNGVTQNEAAVRRDYAAKYSALALEALQLRTRASHSEQGAQ